MARTEVTGAQIRDSSVGLTADVTGILPVANGGTGSDTIALNNVMLGNGTGAVQTVAPGAAGNVLKSNGTTWTSGSSDPGAGSYPRVYAPTTGRWIRSGPGGVTDQEGTGLGYMRSTRIHIPATITFDRIACNVTIGAANALVRLGIYTSNSNGVPSSLVLDAGTADASTSGVKQITINQQLTAGDYWLSLASQGATCTIHTFSGANNFCTTTSFTPWGYDCWNIAGITGALPASYNEGGSSMTYNAPLMMLRAA